MIGPLYLPVDFGQKGSTDKLIHLHVSSSIVSRGIWLRTPEERRLMRTTHTIEV